MANSNSADIGFEKQIWDAACVLWGHIPATEYRKVIIGLIFLRYISNAFEKKYEQLVSEGDGFEDDPDAYVEDNIFFVPECARWNVISNAAHTSEIGKVIDDAMRAIEEENTALKNVLPKNSIDGKIALNNKINNNLEQQAISIFNNNIAILSKNGQLGDYCSVKSGFAFKSAWWTTSGVRVIKIGSINQDALDLNACSYVAPDKASFAADFTVKGGDLLIAMTGATIGKFAMVPQTSDILLVNQRVGKFFR